MTPTEALTSLVAAGRIKSAWIPGMLSTNGYRCISPDESWSHPPDGSGTADSGGTSMGAWSNCRLYTPDFTDPATLGCLLALVREAWGDPTLSIAWAGGSWYVVQPIRRGVEALKAISTDTEATAITAALVAAAESTGA